jgi:K+-sensing histidine kinase KdpD
MVRRLCFLFVEFLLIQPSDIRTPLNILCGMADELHTHYTETEHDVSTDLVLLRSASFWLLAHANNTLDVCSLELGTIRVEHLPFSPSAYAALPSPRLCGSV